MKVASDIMSVPGTLDSIASTRSMFWQVYRIRGPCRHGGVKGAITTRRGWKEPTQEEDMRERGFVVVEM
jgi:hypothetical protein